MVKHERGLTSIPAAGVDALTMRRGGQIAPSSVLTNGVRREEKGPAAWRYFRQLWNFIALGICAVPVIAQSPPPPLPLPTSLPVSPKPATLVEIEAGAPPAAWRAIRPENLILLDTARGTLTIELAPDFAPSHVAAIRALVRAGAFTGGAVTRVQDNYVVQWGTRAAAADAAPPTTPPAVSPPELPPEYERPAAAMAFTPLPYRDAYAAEAGFSDGWPVAREAGSAWLVHCYAMVGAGRNEPPSTGDGSELYAVTGHAPRHLDRNMAVVGRVIDGLPNVTALPRGTEALGFYKTAAERLPITGARLASDVANAVRWQVLRTDSATFAALITARANRREPFFLRPAAAVDVCNVKIPVRRAD